MGLPDELIFANHVARLRYAAARLEENRPDAEGPQVFPTDAVILLALGAEIGLKALICFERKLPDTKSVGGLISGYWNRHDLLLLHGLLSEGLQAELKDMTLAKRPKESRVRVAFNFAAPSLPGPIRVDCGEDFESWLESARFSFEAWRYHYESPQVGPLNISMFNCYVEAIEQALRELK